MIVQYGKRALSLFLVIVMIFTAVPVQTFAVEDEYNHEHQTEDSGVVFDLAEVPEGAAVPDESEALIALRAEIAAYVEALGITPNMSDQYLLYAYGNHESQEAAEASLTKQDEFWAKGAQLSEEERQILLAEPNTELCIRYREVAQNAYGTMMVAEYTENGVTFASQGNLTNSEGVLTATVAGTNKGCGESATMTLFITNTSGEDGFVSFDMQQTQVHTIKIGSADGTATDEDIKNKSSYSRALSADEGFSIIITTDKNSTVNELKLSNITFTSANQSFTVTVEYPDAFGSVTASAIGTSEKADGITTMTIPDIKAVDGVTLTATSSTFLCWVDKDNRLLSKDNVCQVNPSADTTVRAVMTNGKAHFLVNGKLVCSDLNDAIDRVGTASNKTIVLANDGILPEGNYTIPEGVTLLIPFDDANTMYTTAPECVDSYTTPSAYRTLTMAEGAHITVNGAISVSAKQSANQGKKSNGAPTGKYGVIDMQQGSVITVNSGAYLYAWGYIAGQGAVTVENGGTVYEDFQVTSWRGGTATSGMLGNEEKVFPMSSYYVQNVQVPMTLKQGAVEYGYTSVAVTLLGVQKSAIPFIGRDGMFYMDGTGGSITKDYDEETDRLVINMDGGSMKMQPLKLSMSGVGTIDSSSYVLPINTNITVNINSGSKVEISQNIALLPGACINIGAGAECTLAEKAQVYVYDSDNWGNYLQSASYGQVQPAVYAHNRKYTRKAGDLVDAEVIVNGTMNASAGYVYTTVGNNDPKAANIRSTGNGQIILGTAGTEEVTYQATQGGSDGKQIDYVSIPITPAKLKNADGTYLETGNAGTYKYVGGEWTFECAENHSFTNYESDGNATCTADGTKTATCDNCDATDTVTDEGTKKAHSFTNYVSDGNATCTEDGTKTAKCDRCDATDTVADEGSMLEHSFTNYVSNNNASCTADGTKTATCENCTETDTITDEGSKKAHSFTNYVSDGNATCTADGTKTAKCDNCTATDTVTDEGSMLDHSFTNYESDGNATCTADGTKTATCDHCTETDTIVDEGSMLDHSFTNYVSNNNATCTADGTETATCDNDNCDATDTRTDVDSATGHSFTNYVSNDDASCTADGTKTAKCDNCEETNTVADVDSATGHEFGAETPYKPADCETVGNDAYKQCAVCELYFAADAETNAVDGVKVADEFELPVLGHPDVDPEDYYCDICEKNLCEKHDYEESVTKPATCTADGVKTFVCKMCKSSHTETIGALGHKFTDYEANDATCENAGNHAYKQCTVCELYFAADAETNAVDGAQDNSQFVIGKEAHSFTNYVSDGNASCTVDGTKTAKCDNCDATDTIADEGSMLEHSFTNYVSDGNATCTADGTKTATCDNCTATDTIADEGSMLEHSFTNYVSNNDASCTADGTKTATCDNCTATDTVADEGSMLEHSFTNYVSDGNASCTEDGTKTATCDNCTATDTVADEGSMLEHSFTKYVSDGNATCTVDGTETAKCDNCDATDTVTDEDSMLEHSFTNYESDGNATCTADGTKTATCDNCEETNTVADEGSMLDHSFTDYVSNNDATCTEDGTKTATCDNCDATDTVTDEGSKLDHEFGKWTVSKPATCTADGEQVRECACGQTETEPIEKLGHTKQEVAAVEPTCEEAGHEAGVQCSVCGETLEGMKEIAALKHDLESYEAKEGNCGEIGWDAYETCKREGCEYTTYVEIPASGNHSWIHYDAKKPTYTEEGHDAYSVCYECGATDPEGYERYPALGEPAVESYDEFLMNLSILEQFASAYVNGNASMGVAAHPGKDPIALVIKYIRTGVDRYNSGSWGIMAGYEDADFAKFVTNMENQLNAAGGIDINGDGVGEQLAVTGMKDIKEFILPNGDLVDFGHMFGTMDITYHNTGSQNHADVGGWAGDLVDLMTAADRAYSGSADSSVKLDPNVDLETMTKEIREQIFLKTTCADDKFALTDYYGDIDGLYVMQKLYASDYVAGTMAAIIEEYCTADLNDVSRAEFFLKNRLGTSGTRAQVRDAVYSAYSNNKTITTLESTRDFLNTDAKYLEQLRKATCYAFADYVCELAGDYVEIADNPYYTDFDSERSLLAPGVVQEIHKATSADNKQMVYYLATADLTNEYVTVYANYNENDPGKGWAMARVLDQANAAQNKHSDPNSEHYIENYQVVAAINADGFNMSTGEPGGLLVMDGKEWHAPNSNGFFGITKEGKPVIGTTAEYNSTYKGQLRDAVAAFGTTLVKDGKVSIKASSDYYTSRASRTAVGITKTGKVVFMVLDGRQEPVSCGGSMEEIAQIMLEAGCEIAINLDGGGSTTFVSKPEGSDELQVTSKPSDGYARSVSSTLMIVSTAPSSTAFDHAVLNSDYDYSTIGTSVTITPVGVSATGNVAELPEGYTWAVSDDRWGSITEDGVFTGLRTGDVEVMLMLGEDEIGSKTMHVVTPDNVYFTRNTIDAVYGSTITLPVAALYENKPVAISEDDVEMTMSVDAGTIDGFKFTAEESDYRNLKITVALKNNPDVKGSITVNLYKQGENSFDFDQATAGDRQLAWLREVSNSTTEDNISYNAIDRDGDMVTNYIFAMDMTQIPIPGNLGDLVGMLPGADAANASAWNFLLQLAERVSVLTEVTPVMDFDDRFDVDYSELKVLNEYFKLDPDDGITFNEATNTLTLKLNWVDQTQAIDAATANPLCLVSGVKLTPKEGAFADGERINAVNTGKIGYKIYLRANALYSFSQKKENQEKYGLQPFVNPNLPSESGGYLQSIYKTFEDSFTLSYAEKKGWVKESSGYAYYVDGAKLTDVQLVDGYYYDFGDNGINIGQTKFTGIFRDGDNNRYAKLGEIVTSGWNLVGDVMYHCNDKGYAHEAKAKGGANCTTGGYLSYTCNACGVTERVGNYVMPSGHDWDADHVCKVCNDTGKDITTLKNGFGTLDKPVAATPTPKYYYLKAGVRPYTYVADGRTVLNKSSDATLNSDGTMRDLFISWNNSYGIGKAVVNISGKANYYGEIKLEYIIVPNDVTDLKTSAVSADSVTLTWSKVDGADTYTVYRVVDSEYQAVETGIKGTNYTVDGLEAGVPYKFVVKGSAVSTDGEEQVYESPKYSNTVTVLDGKATVSNSTTGTGAIGGGSGSAGGGGGGAAGGGGGGGGAAVTDGHTASSVKDLISGIGKVDKDSEQAIAAAREAYDSLTPSQKQKVENYEELLAAEQKLIELLKEQEKETDVATTLNFADVKEENWFHNDVQEAYSRGLMKGTSDDKFEPQAPLSRAMLVTILYRLEGEMAVADGHGFNDVKNGQWYTDAIAWAAANEIVNGLGEGKFAPNDNVTREQIAAILMRYSEYKGYDVSDANDLGKYLDAGSISTWAEEAMEWANAMALIAGDNNGKLNSQGKATRAEAATILIRYIDNVAA